MQFANYAEFWPYYLSQHSRWGTKVLHSIGLVWALTTVIAGVWAQSAWLMVLAIPIGYAPAWIGHFFVEENKPATWSHPLWSFISDFRMVFLFLTGKLR